MKCSDILQQHTGSTFTAIEFIQIDAELMGQRNYVPEATLFTDFPLFEDLRMFISGILHSHFLEKNLCFFQQFCSSDWRNALEKSCATKTFLFHPITSASTCSCSVTLEL